MKAAFFLGMAVAGSYARAIALNFIDKKKVGLIRALDFVGTKGMINLGSGCTRTAFASYVCNLDCVRYNIDIAGPAEKLVIDLELAQLPFSDKQFDVAFGSHVLEHLRNWEAALDEWVRVADHVVLVLPHPWSISGRLNPDHWQHFSSSDMRNIMEYWPSVEVFC